MTEQMNLIEPNLEGKNYTQSMWDEFSELVFKTSSPDQMERIEARFGMPKFIELYGKDVCDEMFADGAGEEFFDSGED